MEQKNRPFRTDREFHAEKELVFKVFHILKRRYNEHMETAPLGLYDSTAIEKKVFREVKKEAGPITKAQEFTIEAIFDCFAGAMIMFQNSGLAFHMLEVQFDLIDHT